MRVLVTGASGLLGSAVSDALLARGDEVVGLSRNPEKARSENPTVTWHAWEPTTERPPPESLEGVDGIVNLLGEEINQRLTEAAKRRIRESRVTASRNLVQGVAAASTRPKVFVGQSAVGYYGDRGAQLLDEDSGHGDRWDAHLCVDWEGAEHAAVGHVDRLLILVTAAVLTKEGGLMQQLALPFKLGLGGPIGSGEQYMPWIHIDDQVGMVLWALDDESVSGVVNATAPTPVTNREFSKALGEALNRPVFMRVPRFAVAALRGGELADIVLGG